MDDNNKKDGMGNCSCNCMGCKGHGMMGNNMCCGGWGGWGGGHHVSLFRIILMFVLLGFVFSFGVKMGEFKAEMMNYGWGGSEEHMMRGGYGYPGMMYPLQQGTLTQPSATPTK